MPAPQAFPLATAAGAHLPGLQSVRYAPCWALLLAFAETVGPRADRIRPHDDAVAWIARDAGKPGRRNAETFVIHASPDWSRAHLERPAGEVAIALLARFRALVGVSAAPSLSAAHRWRYAPVEQAAGSAFLWDGRARIGACGIGVSVRGWKPHSRAATLWATWSCSTWRRTLSSEPCASPLSICPHCLGPRAPTS